MANELMSEKIDLYRQFLRMLSGREISQIEYEEIIDLIERAKSFDDLNCVCDKFQVAPF